MNDSRRFTSQRSLNDDEYIEAVKLRDKLSKQIEEYENECRRGIVKVCYFKSHSKYAGSGDCYSLRYNAAFGNDKAAYWKTLHREDTPEEMLRFLTALSADLPLLVSAYKEKIEREEPANE